MRSLAFRNCLRNFDSYGRRFLSSQLPACTTDKFGGITLDIGQLAETNQCATTPEEFDKQLAGWLQQWRKDSVKAAWLDIPIEMSCHVGIAARHGFRFHHAEGSSSTLCQWLVPNRSSGLPRYATHQVGCSGCVVREDTEQVLVVRDRYNPFSLWKFPGGLSELSEDIEATAKREVFEETGIKSEFRGVMMFRQQHNHPGAFGRSDMFFVCHMTPLTFDISLDPLEITHCQWIGLDDLEASSQKSAITVRAVNMVRKGLKEGFDSVTLGTDKCKSVYKGMEFKVHNPRVEGLIMDEKS